MSACKYFNNICASTVFKVVCPFMNVFTTGVFLHLKEQQKLEYKNSYFF